MGRSMTRRELLKLAGGSALGMMLTPVPWKLLGDATIWTQNWPAIARPLRGDITFRPTACALCPAGCGVNARCVAGVPVRLSGVRDDPVGGGALCPVGLAGHQLPWHPARARGPMMRKRHLSAGRPGAWTDMTPDAAVALAAAALRERRAGERVVILDDRPGRVRSELYRAFCAAVTGGAYVASPARWNRPLETMAAMFETAPAGSLAVDPRKAEAILTFGAPVLDGHGGPGLTAALLTARRAGGRPEIIAAEPQLSRTASLGDRWLPLHPGSEIALALGLAHVLRRDGLLNEAALRALAIDLEAFDRLVTGWTPVVTASITGLAPRQIEETAWLLARRSVVVLGTDPATGPASREEETIVATLNLLLSAGRGEGLLTVCGAPLPPALDDVAPGRVNELDDIPNGSVRLLILDAADAGGSLAWSAVAPKMTPGGGLVVSLSPWRVGLGRHADLIVPAPAALEGYDELTGPECPAAGFWRVAPPLLPAPDGSMDPIDFVRRLAASSGVAITGDAEAAPATDLLRRRAARIQAAGRGRLVMRDGAAGRDVAGMTGPGDLWNGITAGGQWVGDADQPRPARCRLLGPTPDRLTNKAAALLTGRNGNGTGSESLVVSSVGWSASHGPGAVAPLLTKLYQESNLRDAAPAAALNPATARTLGLKAGAAVRIETANGLVRRRVELSSGVPPGTVALALGPAGASLLEATSPTDDDARDLFVTGDPSAPRTLPARIGKA